MKIRINKKEYEAKEGERIYDVAERNGIMIPTLCSTKKFQEGACRICSVECGGRLITSCNAEVREGMEIETESENIEKARRINLELLWSDHAGKCFKCKKNRSCELQDLAEEYKIENFHFVPRKGEMTSEEENDLLKDNWSRNVFDDKNPVIERDSQYCVECRRCINICPVKSYGFNKRAGDVVVGTPYNEPLDCIFCGACVKYCPTGALSDQGDIQEIIEDLDDLNILSVAIYDPAIFESAGREIDGAEKPEVLTGALRSLGFERIFSLAWGYEKYVENILEEIHPHHSKKNEHKTHRRFISSFCPSAELYIKKCHPELEPLIVKTKRPEEIMAEAVKSEYAKREKIDPKNIRTVLISACTARKKLKGKVIKHVITVRELGRIARDKKLETDKIKPSKADKFLSAVSDEFSNVYEYGQLSKTISRKLGEKFSVGAANGALEIKNALGAELKKESRYDFLEVMMCPGGCEKGGGQSIKNSKF